jgi:hypothetical protein
MKLTFLSYNPVASKIYTLNVLETEEWFRIFTAFGLTAVIRYLRLEFKFSAKIEMAFSQMLAIRS